MEPVIGIDLGTTFSCVAVWDWSNSHAEIVANEQGNRTMPSIVSHDKDDLLVGEAARNKLAINPENTICNAKRIIGRPFSQIRQEDFDSWPFKVVCLGSDDKPRYRVEYQGEERLVSPEEISAMVLHKLKEAAEHHLGVPVSKAVVTVPAYFTEPQKRATKDAALLAGLEVLGLLPEPTAAALAYGLDQKSLTDAQREKMAVDGWYILVFDLGGGTLDVSVLRLDGRGSFVTKAITGDFHLGGEDFDNVIVNHIISRFRKDNPGVELSRRSVRRLRTECEKVKRMLSDSMSAVVDMELQGIDIAYEIRREEFEELCEPLFQNLVVEIETALSLAKILRQDVDDIVLVGAPRASLECKRSYESSFPERTCGPASTLMKPSRTELRSRLQRCIPIR